MGTVYPDLSINLGTFETDYPMRIKALIYQFSILPLQVCTTIHRQQCAPITKQHCTVADEPVCDTVYEVSNIEEESLLWTSFKLQDVCTTVPEPVCQTGDEI